jgi:hypothetical protein
VKFSPHRIEPHTSGILDFSSEVMLFDARLLAVGFHSKT